MNAAVRLDNGADFPESAQAVRYGVPGTPEAVRYGVPGTPDRRPGVSASPVHHGVRRLSGRTTNRANTGNGYDGSERAATDTKSLSVPGITHVSGPCQPARAALFAPTDQTRTARSACRAAGHTGCESGRPAPRSACPLERSHPSGAAEVAARREEKGSGSEVFRGACPPLPVTERAAQRSLRVYLAQHRHHERNQVDRAYHRQKSLLLRGAGILGRIVEHDELEVSVPS